MSENSEDKGQNKFGGQVRISMDLDLSIGEEATRLSRVENRKVNKYEVVERMWDAYQRVVMNTPKVHAVPESVDADASASVPSNASELFIAQVRELMLQELPEAIVERLRKVAPRGKARQPTVLQQNRAAIRQADRATNSVKGRSAGGSRKDREGVA